MKKEKNSIEKENFLDFLASATPEEVNNMILEKGKPRKLIEPFIFFKNRDSKNDKL